MRGTGWLVLLVIINAIKCCYSFDQILIVTENEDRQMEHSPAEHLLCARHRPRGSPHQQGRGEGCRHPDFPSEQKSGASSEATEGALNPSA